MTDNPQRAAYERALANAHAAASGKHPAPWRRPRGVAMDAAQVAAWLAEDGWEFAPGGAKTRDQTTRLVRRIETIGD